MHDVRLFYAIELRVFYARCAIVLRNRVASVLCMMCECFMHDVRGLMRRGRGAHRGGE